MSRLASFFLRGRRVVCIGDFGRRERFGRCFFRDRLCGCFLHDCTIGCALGSGGRLGLLALDVDERIDENAEDERAGDCSDSDLSEGERHSAHAGDEDGRDDEEVAVLVEVDLLDHLQTADGDEAVERNAHAAHDAGGNGGKEGDEGSDERRDEGDDGRRENGDDGGVARDGDAADGFTVRRIGAAAEERAHHGADSVAEEGSGKAGIGEQIVLDDGGDVLVIGEVFRKDDERHRNIGNGDGADIGTEVAHVTREIRLKEGLDEGEVGHPLHALKEREVNEAQAGIDAGNVAESRKDGGKDISRQDTDDEGNHLHHLLAVNGADDGGGERHKGAQQGKPCMEIHCVASADEGGVSDGLSHRASREGKSDERNRGADDDGGHDLIDPANACELDDNGDDDVDKSRKHGADQDSKIADRLGRRAHGRRACKCRSHRTDEGKGAAEEYGAFELGKEQVDERARACAEQRRRNGHIAFCHAVDLNGDGNGRRQDRQQLLQREQDDLPGLGSVFDTVDELHW